MNTFMKDKNTGKYAVIGPTVQVGTVLVHKKNGETTEVEVGSVSKDFEGKFGENKGVSVRIGTLVDKESGIKITHDRVVTNHMGDDELDDIDF